ncbi:hypothetical protein BT69DRAFT_1306079, partial [Atractiella rhizophila]
IGKQGPAWKMQKGKLPNERTCKHLKQVLSEAYEEERLKQYADTHAQRPPEKNVTSKPASKAKPASKSGTTKPVSKTTRTTRGKVKTEEDEGEAEEEEEAPKKPTSRTTRATRGKAKVEEEEEEAEWPPKRSRSKPPSKSDSKPPSKSSKPPSKTAATRVPRGKTPKVEEEDEQAEEAADEAMDVDDEDREDDPVWNINGVKPLKKLKDQEFVEVEGSGSSKYKVKRINDHYSCTCPAWAFLKGINVDCRSCKHCKAVLGEESVVFLLRFT